MSVRYAEGGSAESWHDLFSQDDGTTVCRGCSCWNCPHGEGKPCRIRGCGCTHGKKGYDPMFELGRVTQQWFPDDQAVVCVTHRRFVPCRRDDGSCVYSEDEWDVRAVTDWQRSHRA